MKTELAGNGHRQGRSRRSAETPLSPDDARPLSPSVDTAPLLQAVRSDAGGRLAACEGRIIFVNRFFHPDISATSRMLSELAFDLARHHDDVHVITSRMRYDEPGAVLPGSERIAGVQVHRVATTRLGRHRVRRRLIDYLSFYVTMAIAAMRHARRGDTLVVKTDPPMLAAALVCVARLKGARVVNWYQDVFPEVAEVAGVVLGPPRMTRALLGLSRRLRDWSLRRSDRTVVIGDTMRDVIARRAPDERIVVIPNWADTLSIVPIAAAANPLRREWGLDGRFVVAYSGNMGMAHPFEAIVEAIEHLREDPRIVFLFIGGGVKRPQVKEALEVRGLADRALFKAYQPDARLSESLGVGDVHLVCLDPDMEGLVVPSKFYGIAAAARPTLYIGDTDGELAREIVAERCGVVHAPGDGVGLARSILAYADDAKRCRTEGERARRHVVAHRSRESASVRWAALLAEPRCRP